MTTVGVAQLLDAKLSTDQVELTLNSRGTVTVWRETLVVGKFGELSANYLW